MAEIKAKPLWPNLLKELPLALRGAFRLEGLVFMKIDVNTMYYLYISGNKKLDDPSFFWQNGSSQRALLVKATILESLEQLYP